MAEAASFGFHNLKTETPAGVSQVHMLPVNDIRRHELAETCACRPVEDHEASDFWMHNAWDGREDYFERGRKLQ